MCTDILKSSISFNYKCGQQTIVIIAVPDTDPNHQYFEITSLLSKISCVITSAHHYCEMKLVLLVSKEANVTLSFYYKNVKSFLGCISLQLVSFVILCILLYALKQTTLRGGLQASRHT